MRLFFEAEFVNGEYCFVRAGRFEIHVQLHKVPSPQGWLSWGKSRMPKQRELMLNVRCKTIHFVNHDLLTVVQAEAC